MSAEHILVDVRRALATLIPGTLRLVTAMFVAWFALVVTASALGSVVALWLTGFLR